MIRKTARLKDASATYDVLLLILPEHPTNPLSVEIVNGWSDDQRAQAETYASCVYAAAGDHDGVELPPVPEHLAPYLETTKW